MDSQPEICKLANDISIRKSMEESDLPKLSSRFRSSDSLLEISWQVYKQRLNWLLNKGSLKRISDSFDYTNPLISLFTWTVMIPVGGTFCRNF